MAVRRLLARPALAALLLAATLLLRLFVPAGYMIGGGPGAMRIELCPAAGPAPMAAMPHMGMPGHARGDHGGHGQHGKAGPPCAFSGLAAAWLGAADPVLLAAHLAFVVAAGVRPPLPPAVARRAHLRPPLRGPPTHR